MKKTLSQENYGCKRILLACLFLLTFFCKTAPLLAQEKEQLWLDLQTSYPFANRYLLENTVSYQTVFDKKNKWRNFSTTPTFEYALFYRLELLSEIAIGYTLQKVGNTTFELMPMVGGRFHITQGKRIDTRLVLRYQTRAFQQLETKEWDVSNRTRLRGEIYICINGPNLFTDGLWYTFADYEEFLVLDQQLNERFANRRRGRIGLGYRYNYQHRFDLSYTLQSSRNQIDSKFLSIDNVIQLKYKLYFNPSTPSSD